MLHHHLTAPPPKVYVCSKCGRQIVGIVYKGYGFAYHPRCYTAIYGWPQD